MLFTRISLTKLKSSIFSITKPLHLLQQQEPIYIYIQKCNYVEVTMKWKKDAFYDSIGIIHKSQDLRPLISLKNCILEEPNGCIPISAISKRGLEFGISEKVASFFRRYPSVFEEYVGPQYNLPWFRLSQEAILLDEEERRVYQDRKGDIVDRLKKFILMSEEKKLPLKIIQGMQWYLGVPDEFLKNPESNLDESFSFIEMEEGLIGLCVRTNEKALSVMQKNALKKGEYVEGPMAPLVVPLFPSKGLRLKRKISNWLDEFQKLPYVSPYEDCSCLNHNSDIFEKRVVGVLHELLSLFVDHSAERKKLFCLRPYLGLPQKFYKAFARHPHTFYLSLKNKTCTAILKEAYNDNSAMETHPILEVRQKYIRLMDKSGSILRNKRQRKEPGGRDSESNEESECQRDSKSSEESKCRPSRVCGNPHGLIRKYGLMCCRQCFRSNAKEIGFIKYR